VPSVIPTGFPTVTQPLRSGDMKEVGLARELVRLQVHAPVYALLSLKVAQEEGGRSTVACVVDCDSAAASALEERLSAGATPVKCLPRSEICALPMDISDEPDAEKVESGATGAPTFNPDDL
jgi:hypothetical protein